MRSEFALLPLAALTDGTPITYGVVKPGDEAENGVAFVRGGDVLGGRVLVSQLRTISSEVSAQYARTLLRGGELLISLVGNPGEVAIAPPSLRGANIARQVGLIRIDPSKADANYIQCFLRSKVGRDLLLAHSKDSVQQVINLRDLKSIRVPLPSLAVQKEVSSLVQSFDHRIALLRETNATLEAIAQALFKSWFVDYDPVHAKSQGLAPAGMDEATAALFPDSFEESALGLVPKGWRLGVVQDVANLRGGQQLSKDAFDENGRNPVFGGAGVMGRTNLTNADGFVITVGRVGAYCGRFFWHHGGAWVNNNASLIKPTNSEDSVWLYEWLRSTNIDEIKKGAAQPFVSNGDIAALKIRIPPVQVVRRFVESCDPIYRKLEQLQQQAQTLATLRDTLLPRLISGQLRLLEAEAILTTH